MFFGHVVLNSLAPGGFHLNFREVILKLILVNGGWGISYEITLRWMPQDLTDDKSTLVQVMAWCRQATSHYLGQWWTRSMSPDGVTRPQWVNTLKPQLNGRYFVDDIFKFIFLMKIVVFLVNITEAPTDAFDNKSALVHALLDIYFSFNMALKLRPTWSLPCWSNNYIYSTHKNVMTWKHFPHYWPFVRGPPQIIGFPSQRTISVELWYFLCC